ncbi:uncharacterized protein TNCV_3405081 [Trichonephila clavipes]|nr:uncharacterized protein TNCV_3405081 [Trichonephila clavipes]
MELMHINHIRAQTGSHLCDVEVSIVELAHMLSSSFDHGSQLLHNSHSLGISVDQSSLTVKKYFLLEGLVEHGSQVVMDKNLELAVAVSTPDATQDPPCRGADAR